jgi:peptide/nickel transport system ATP-binding protein
VTMVDGVRPNATPGGGPPLLEVRDLRVEFRRRHEVLQAVSGVSLTIEAGETLGLVGESGCGKSTTGRAIVQVERPAAGSIFFDGVELTALDRSELRRARVGMQMIFQDPISSLNPRRRVRDIVAEPLDIWKRATGDERQRIVRDMLEAVGLDPDASGGRRPREFSGGRCQRISIARALVMEPKLLVCDEVVSALDVSIQAQILNLLEDLKARYGLTLLFIAHDLAVVKNISDRVAVMYLGKLCEVAPADTLYREPAHHYTKALMGAALEPDPSTAGRPPSLTGEPPSPVNPPSGCRFRTRCPRAEARCAAEEPAMRQIAPGHTVACHFPLVGPVAPAAGTDHTAP